MAAGLATLPVPLQASRTCSGLKSSVKFVVCHDRRLERHFVAGGPPLSSLMSHKRCRNVFTLIPCRHTRLASVQVSKSASLGPVRESQGAAVDSQSASPHAQIPIIRGTQENGEIDIYATALGLGFGLVLACALQFPEAAVAATESGFPTVMTFAGAEPSNALSLPTWVIHVASVVEW